ncbi:unnamed protein product [Urochloa decumbens]|uniref:Uncharacterized protein n=1 Tax=Urochloa decumbens TaxID=240449 RepID=A0ABC9AIJ3_9POAL
MASDGITLHVEWLAWRLTQQQEDAAAKEQHRIMVTTHCVSRVPGHLRATNPDTYTPGLVAIGPLHAKDAERRLRRGNRLKMAYLNSLISRGHPDASGHLAVIQGYVRLVAAREREARAMYAAEDVDNIPAEDFIQMLVLDGCFILEHLVNFATGREEASLHAIPFGPAQLSVDLVLAENQIPFFVLADLIGAGQKGRDMTDVLPRAGDVCHILHLLHSTVSAARTRWEPPQLLLSLPLLLMAPLLYPILPDDCKWSARYGPVSVPSASDMKWLGVRLKKADGGGGGGGSGKASDSIVSVLGPVPLAVKLDRHGVLRLGQLKIEFRTVPLLFNLIAFENSAEVRAGNVLAYTWFMAIMVQSAEDAAVLVEAEMVRGGAAGNETNADVVRFFRHVSAACEGALELEVSYLGETLQWFKGRTQHPLFAKRLADMQRYYITVPWRIVTAFGTVITTVLGILQAVTSFKQKPA